jgi:hypothetical protein
MDRKRKYLGGRFTTLGRAVIIILDFGLTDVRLFIKTGRLISKLDGPNLSR